MKRLPNYPYVVAIIDQKIQVARLDHGFLPMYAGQINWEAVGSHMEPQMIEEIILCLNLSWEQQVQFGLT